MKRTRGHVGENLNYIIYNIKYRMVYSYSYYDCCNNIYHLLHGIYNFMSGANHVSRVYSVSAIL
jgi:hypothetical protein